MATFLTEDDRKARLGQAAARLGGKAALGRRLGYKNGAFVGQMIRGERPITEKTLRALLDIREVSDLFAFRAGPSPDASAGFAMSSNDEAKDPELPAAAAPPKASRAERPFALPQALTMVFDAIARAPDKVKLRTALLALLDDDDQAYRDRVTRLLTEQPMPEPPKPDLTRHRM